MSKPFTLAILPDTQIYSESFPHIFTAQTQWIADKKDEHNIVFTLHEGDITNRNTEVQWQNASNSMGVLEGEVPYAIVMGNHDMGPDGDSSVRDSMFDEYFPVSRYSELPTFGGTFRSESLDNSYHLFEAGDTGWLIVALEFMPRDSVIEWANDVAASNADRKVIVLTHSHVHHNQCLYGSEPGPAGTMGIISSSEGCNDGIDTWKKLMRRHQNMFLVFNGHFLGQSRITGTGNEGNLVHQMLSNYQDMPEGGQGYLRLVECDPSNRTISVKTYSPYLDTYIRDEKNEFVIQNADLG